MTPEITSSSDPDDPRPWFDYRVSTDLWVDVLEANGVAAAGWTNASEQAEQALKDDSRHSLALNPNKSEEEHVLAVDIDGQLVFVAASEQAPIYYAHLARYDPVAGEWTETLRFTE